MKGKDFRVANRLLHPLLTRKILRIGRCFRPEAPVPQSTAERWDF